MQLMVVQSVLEMYFFGHYLVLLLLNVVGPQQTRLGVS
jgi:hypothetical protein